MICTRDISYNGQCELDVFQPACISDGPLPAVVVVHGGAWTFGNREYAHDIARHICHANYIVVTPGYTLSSIDRRAVTMTVLYTLSIICSVMIVCGTFERYIFILFTIMVCILSVIYLITREPTNDAHPTHVSDIADSIRWVLLHISEHGGDPSRIALVGHSAGAHICSLVACNTRFLHRVGVEASVIKAVVGLSGVYSDVRMLQTRIGTEILINAFGLHPQYYDAFPLYHVRASVPAHLLINADRDYTLKRHTYDFYTALVSRGVPCETRVYPNTTHFSIRHYWDGANRAVRDDILLFLSTHLRSEVSM